MVHFIEETEDRPLRADVEVLAMMNKVRVRLFLDDELYTIIKLTGTDTRARARRIADAINEGGRADAAPVE